MATDENKALIRRMWEEVPNQGRVERVDDYNAPEFLQFGTRVGTDQFKGIVTMLHTAFTDMHSTIDQIVAEDDLVVCDVTARGTQHGPFHAPGWGPVPPEGSRMPSSTATGFASQTARSSSIGQSGMTWGSWCNWGASPLRQRLLPNMG